MLMIGSHADELFVANVSVSTDASWEQMWGNACLSSRLQHFIVLYTPNPSDVHSKLRCQL